MNLIDNKRCFVCGKENESGLKIDFFIENRRIRAEFSIDNRFQGFSGIVHGGIISTILDEAMVKLAFGLGFSAVTANLNVNLRKPAKPNEKLIATGEIIGDFGRKIKANKFQSDFQY